MNAMEIELKSKIDILEKKCDIELDSLTNAFQDRLENIKHDYETKLKDMERRFLLLISANERKHQFAFEELQIVCKNNEKIIEILKDGNKVLKEEMLHHLKDQVECTRTHGDVKRKWIENENEHNIDENEEKKSRLEKMEALVVEANGRLDILEDDARNIRQSQDNSKKSKDLEYYNLHKFAEIELKKIKIFILKEKMIGKNVEKVKEMIRKIGSSYERSSKGMDSRTNIITKIFKNIYKTIEDLPNIKYKDVVKSEIDQLIEICEKEQKVQKI